MSESPVRLVVQGLPPKKDGTNSMWRKGQDVARLKCSGPLCARRCREEACSDSLAPGGG